MACYTIYKCKKCNRTCVLSGCSNSPGSKYVRTCIPVGTGSAKFMEWVCSDCDPEGVERYKEIHDVAFKNGLCPWLEAPVM